MRELLYLEVEVRRDAFVLLELKICPLTVVEELLQCLFQLVEDALIGYLNGTMVYGELSPELLSTRKGITQPYHRNDCDGTDGDCIMMCIETHF